MNSNTAPDQLPPYAAASEEALDASLTAFVAALGRSAAEDPEPLSCAACRAHFPALYHLSAADEPLGTEEQAARAHLAHCPACAAEYAALQEVLGELAAGTLPALAANPTFDLSFLTFLPADAPALPASPALWQQELGDGVRRLFAELQVALRTTGAAFGALPASLVPTPLTLNGSAVFRSDTPVDHAAGHAEVLVLPASDAGISIHLAVGPLVAGSAVVMVKLLAMPSTQPLGNTRVTLRNAQRQLLMGLATRPDGTAVFEQLPLGRYFVQVRFEQQVWEIPLVIVAGSPPLSPTVPTE